MIGIYRLYDVTEPYRRSYWIVLDNETMLYKHDYMNSFFHAAQPKHHIKSINEPQSLVLL